MMVQVGVERSSGRCPDGMSDISTGAVVCAIFMRTLAATALSEFRITGLNRCELVSTGTIFLGTLSVTRINNGRDK